MQLFAFLQGLEPLRLTTLDGGLAALDAGHHHESLGEFPPSFRHLIAESAHPFDVATVQLVHPPQSFLEIHTNHRHTLTLAVFPGHTCPICRYAARATCAILEAWKTN
jgi:hypothetical protein